MFTPKLQWIDETDPESIKRSRVHRQKEFHRQKRWKQVRQWQKEKDEGLASVALSREQSSSSGRRDDAASEAVSSTAQSSPVSRDRDSFVDDDDEDVVVANDGTSLAYSSQRTPPHSILRGQAARGSPRKNSSLTNRDSAGDKDPIMRLDTMFEEEHLLNLLTSSRRDPFGTLPFGEGSDSWRNQLVSHFLFDIPRMVYNVKDSKPNREVLFPLATLGPAAFQATLLVQAACHIAQLQGLNDSVDSIEQKSKAIRLIQARLDSPDPTVRTGDEIIAAVLSLADAENLFGFKDKAALHMQGVTAIIKQRGGHRAIDKDRRLGIHMNWVNICLIRPENLAALSSWSVYTVNSSHPLSNNPTPSLDLSDFIDFLTNASLLSLSRLPKRHLLWRKALFQCGSTIYRICEIPANFDAWDTDLIPVYTRLAALMHINAALWEYRDFPTFSDQYLESLDRILIENDFATSFSIGFFCYNMMKLDYDETERQYSTISPNVRGTDDDSEKRSWFVARILRVCKLLGKASMIKVHRILLAFLDPSSIVSMEDLGLDENWTERLRQEIIMSGSGPGSTASSTMNSPT